jgi:hypothetical protein
VPERPSSAALPPLSADVAGYSRLDGTRRERHLAALQAFGFRDGLFSTGCPRSAAAKVPLPPARFCVFAGKPPLDYASGIYSATLARETTVPLQLAIDHGARTVVATGSGILRVEDIQGYFYGLTPATLSYGKLLNLSHCSLDLSAQELAALAQQFNALRLSGRLGPTAVVVRSEATYRQVSDFKAMTALTRPLKIFDECDVAYAWLTANPSEPSSPFAEVPKGWTYQGQREDTRN